MDTSSVPLLDFDLQYQWCSDSDLSSISSSETLSPIHSMDSSLSPSYQQLPQSTSKTAKTGYSQTRQSSQSGRGRKSGRTTRTRSKQRESASEKEKLRMRDLTKALHHLRSYLPPSVAPAGQTLTKIETLRLAIRYISFLSSQLGLSEEALFQRRERGDASSTSDASSPDILSYFQHGSEGVQEAPMQSQGLNQSLYTVQDTVLHAGSCSFGVDQLGGQYFGAPQGDMSVDGMLQTPPGTQPCYQMCGRDFCMPLVPREYWG